MPPRRRGNLSSAAGLPASRLPLGTPILPSHPASPDLQPALGRSLPHLTAQHSALSFDDSDAASATDATDKENQPSSTILTMASNNNNANSDVPAKSIAEAKLERQRKRIAEAEASLTAPPALDRRAQTSRGKNNKWKPFDFTADAATSRSAADDGMPVTEVRVNTFRAPSRADSNNRPGSVLSQRTNETYGSDVERNDLAMLDAGGFQLYQGRKGKKPLVDLHAYEDKPEPRQTTVEAPFDKREIYEVFGNALPSRDFIDENPGSKNGQLQFVQHPNGDVSAHQWSAERYIWENIGQFSNIRKKVEGQLAADRLKGETAYQSMQQNTLAYFRIIAKQREANVMGVMLAAKDTVAALPEPSRPLSAAPTGLKESMDGLQIAQHSPTKVETTRDNQNSSQNTIGHTSSMPSVAGLPNASQPLHQVFSTSHPNVTPNVNLQGFRRDDPFLSHGQHYSIYSTQRPYQQHYQTQMTTSRQYQSAPQQSQALNYGFHFPSQMNATQTSFNTPVPPSASENYPARLLQQMYGTQMGSAAEYGTPHYRTVLNNQPASNTSSQTVSQATVGMSTPQRQQDVSPNPRTAARDQLWKLPETAKERSISQANIRTVLFDPFQSDTTPAKQKEEQELQKQDATPAFAHHVSGNTLRPSTSFGRTASRYFPTTVNPRMQKPSSPSGSSATNNLQDSSPDNQPRRPVYGQSIPTITTTSVSKSTQPFLPGLGGFTSDTTSTSTTSALDTRTHEEKLQEWWTSGNTFTRQEDFYQSLQRAQRDTSTAQRDEPEYARLLIPVIENLASYIQGPASQRHDYFCAWSKPPEWAIDHSETGNNSFFDKHWGTPPARVGRDPRYSGTRGWSATTGQVTPARMVGRRESGGYGGSPGFSIVGTRGVERRFGGGGRF